MASISSRDGARCALRGLTRVLLRVAMLTGLIVCSWLLGSGTGLADEGHSAPSAGLTTAPSLGAAIELHPAPSHPLLAAAEPLLPAPSPVSSLLSPATVPQVVESLVDAVPVAPIVAPVLQPLTPAPADEPAPVRLLAADQHPALAPAEPVVPAADRGAPAALPHLVAAGPVAPAPRSSTAEHPARQFAESPAGYGPSAPLAPASPLRSLDTSGPAGPGTTAPCGPAGTLIDGYQRADLAVVQRRGPSGAGGLPRWPSQQPSTSPD
ncbi:MAG TPA: hypothetical protein VFQ77_05235 [Pseudonocardiaceae bacterium]|nr:hypothetical protein [Pseudonocardiaceae bacterium]